MDAHPSGLWWLQGHQLESHAGIVLLEQEGNCIWCSCDRLHDINWYYFHLHRHLHKMMCLPTAIDANTSCYQWGISTMSVHERERRTWVISPVRYTLLRIMVSQPLGQRCSCLLFYIILIFILITTISWLCTTTTYVSVHQYMYVQAMSIMSFVPADVYSQHTSASHPTSIDLPDPAHMAIVWTSPVTEGDATWTKLMHQSTRMVRM